MFHKSNLGRFGEGLRADMLGYVPEATDGPWDLAVDHGTESTHDPETHELTDYGRWWEEEGFPEWRDAAVETTRKATDGLHEWQESNA